MVNADLDLTHYEWKITRHNIIMYGTWIRINNEFKQCLAFIREGTEGTPSMRPCVITLQQAWKFETKIAGGEMFAAPIIANIVRTLDLKPDKKTFMLIFDMINSRLDDFLEIKPYEELDKKKEVIGELTIKNKDNGKVIEKEITEDYV